MHLLRGWWGWLADAVMVAAILAISSTVAYRFINAYGVRTLTEWESTPAAMWACGQGLTRPVAESPALVEFYMRRRPTLSCAELTDGRPGLVPIPIALSERYALYGAGLAFRIGGVSWQSLDSYMAALFGLAMVAAYGLFRLACSRVPAIAGVACLCYSTHLLGLITLRDFGKEPAFFAAWLALGWLVRLNRHGASRALVVAAAVGGVVLGSGIGFRPDVLVCAPIFVAAIVLVVPGFSRHALKLKTAALAAWLAAFVLTGLPILSGITGGSNSSHVIILGLTTSFERTLGLEPSTYDIGDTYSDGYVYTLVVAHSSTVQHEPQPVAFATSRYDRLGAGLLADLALHFPSDVLTRAVAATAAVLRYPFDPVTRRLDLDSGFFDPAPEIKSAAESVGTWLDRLEGWALIVTGLVLLAITVRDWRLGVLLSLLLAYFCGYSTLQFSRRHTFHLDIIPIGVMVLALDLLLKGLILGVRTVIAPASPAPVPVWPTRLRSGVVAVSLLLAVAVIPIFALRAWQQRHVVSLIERTLGVAWSTVDAKAEPLEDTTENVYAPHLVEWQTALLYRIPPPSEQPATDETLVTRYLRIEIGGAACDQSMVRVAAAYSGSAHTAHREYPRVFEVPTIPGGAPTVMLMPAFFQSGSEWTRFDGVALPRASLPCLGAIGEAVETGTVPVPILTAVLPPDWRERPLYQRMLKDPWR